MTAAAAANAVIWKHLELHGFGRHLSLEISFSPGLTTLVAPNEFGKSTLVAGLSATLFGLPHLSDATKFGRERYRNWSNPSRFEGKVSFEARDGQAHAIHRNFETHEVRIVRHGPGGAEEVFGGEHNPNARTGTGAYEGHLERLVGMTDREAFRQSFHVGQPLPTPDQLGAEVQRLLSGSGQGTFRSGLDSLSKAIGERTSATAELGVSTRNLRKDRRLEELVQRIEELERDLHAGREAADRAEELGEELDRLHHEKVHLQNEERQLKSLEEAFKAWLNAKDAYVREMEAHRSLRDVLQQARRAVDGIETAEAALAETFPQFLDAEPELEADLVAAHEARAELERAEAAEADARRALESAIEEDSAATEALQAHEASEPPHDAELDAREIRDLRAEARRALSDFSRFREQGRAIETRRAELEAYGMLESADEQLRELLRNYRFELDRRQRDVEEETRRAREAAARPVPGSVSPLPADTSGTSKGLLWALVSAVLAAMAAYAIAGSAVIAAVAAIVAGAAGFALAPSRRRDVVAEPHGRPETPEPTDAVPDGEAQRAMNAFVDATRPYVETFGGERADPSEAVRTWEQARRELDAERRARRDHAQHVWGADPADVETLKPMALAGSWSNLARWAQTQGEATDTLAGLGEWLARQDDASWESAIAAAEASEAAHREWNKRHRELERASVSAATRRQQAEDALSVATDKLEAARAAEAAARSEIGDLLGQTESTTGELLARWKRFRDAQRDLESRKQNLIGLLKGRDADSVEQLAEREYRTGMDVMRIANNVDDLRNDHPELPPLDTDREQVARRMREVASERAEVSTALESAENEIFTQTTAKATLAGTDLVNIAQVEIELSELKEERAALEREIEALAVAFNELQAAVTDFQANYRERLERAASAHIQRFSGAGSRRVALGEDFTVAVVEPDGTTAHPGQLSQGTQDQLLLALRLAIADHLSDDAPLPLILDDPFLNWDAQRLSGVEAALVELAQERQVILLSHRREFASWGTPADVS